jgi:hypothetical protein
MRGSIFSFVCLFLLISAGAARADRYHRGLALYQQQCTSCHSMGWKTPGAAEHGRRDLTRVIDSHNDEWLRRWLEDPRHEKKDTGCVHRGLIRDQIEDLIKMFHVRAVDPPKTGHSSSSRGGGAAAPPKGSANTTNNRKSK